MMSALRCALGALAAVFASSVALAAPPTYRAEVLDTGQFDAPSEQLPAGGFLVGPVSISSNGRYVAVLVADRNDPEGAKLLARLDRVAGTAELIPDFEQPVPFGINDDGAIALTARETSPGGIYRQTLYWSPTTGAIPFGEGSLPAQLTSHGDGTGFPRILNDSGQVLVQRPDDTVLWDPRAGTRTIIGLDPGESGSVNATSLNDLGQVVGSVSFPTGAPNELDVRPFLWEAASGLRILEDLELILPNVSPFIPSGRFATANAINDDGVIAGETRDESFGLLGLHWESEAQEPTLLPCQSPTMSAPPQRCAVWLLNDRGDLVGGEEADEEVVSHVIWDGAEPFLLRDLIVEGPNRCQIHAISNDRTLAGVCVGGPALVMEIGAADAEPPVVSDLLADPNPAPVLFPVWLSAEVDDGSTGGGVLAGAHYTVEGGPEVSMAAEDGAFDETRESVVAEIAGFAEPGIYEVCVTGADLAGNVSAPACTLVAVFDPAGGFVTGGGWIEIPAGADPSYPQAQGRANFGFVAKYRKGASTPVGSTEFQFQQGNLNLHSYGYDWLVVTGEDTAQLQGTATVNGEVAPTGIPYQFRLWARDGDPDTFRIRVWWDVPAGEVTVFDSGTRALAGGSIVIHKSGK